jgi:hypothetical protein
MDKVELLFDRPQADPVIRDEIDARIMFHNIYAGYTHRFSPVLSQETSIQGGLQQFKTRIGPDLFFDLDVYRLSFRTAWTLEALSWLDVRAGMDIRLDKVTLEANSPLRPIEGENPPPTSAQEVFGVREQVTLYEPALFLEAVFEPTEGLVISPSLRLDWYRQVERFTLDPRLMARYQLLPTTVLKAGWGIYQQPPTPDQAVPELGNPDLMVPRSTHTSVGVQQQLFEGIELELTGFYKWLDRQVIRNPAFFSDPSLPPYINGGTGRILGLELQLRARIAESFSGWIAYTHQRSYRKDGPGATERLFDFDQPHILTVVGTYEIGWGFSAGLRFRLVSGNPSTPVTGSIYDASAGIYVPVYGPTNSDRLGTFHQLDLRIDRVWTFQLWKLSVYLDVQNVYNRGNPEGVSYNYDYSREQPVTGLPILPILGVKGEW